MPNSKPEIIVNATVNAASASKIVEKLQNAFRLHTAGELEKARVVYEEILILNPKHFEALQLSGMVAAQTKQWDKSLVLFTDALKINITSAIVHNNRGIVLKELTRLDEALACYDLAIEYKPNYAEAYYNRGIVLNELKRLEDALSSYDGAINFKRDFAEAYLNRGTVLKQLKHLEDALTSYDLAIEYKPEYAEAYSNRGILLNELKRLEEALASFDRAIDYRPEYAEAFYNRGIVLNGLKRFEDALASYDRAIEFKPEYAEAYYNRGIVLNGLKRLEDALASYDGAIEYKHDFTDAYYNRGVALQELERLDEALSSYEMVLKLNPNYPHIKGDILYMMTSVNKWDSYDALLESINHDIFENKLSASPFGHQGVCNNPMTLYYAAKIFSNFKYPPLINLSKNNKRIINKKIKIAYLCGEFRQQATSILMINLWENHDKNKFEIIALDNGWDDKSKIRERIERAFDKLINISEMNDLEVANFINEENVDILINLNCFFGLSRNIVFSYKPAPIQVNYLGFPGTLGASYLDYIIADQTTIPKEYQEFYSEKVVYLPNSYQVNDKQRLIADKIFTKEELGLPKDSFVFCCFNNNYKITPHTFDGWVRILKAVEGSVLWLLEDNTTAGINLRKEVQNRGLDPNRLVFAKRIKLPEHLARQRVADLFIDTLPYNAHTTASDALWAGLPVLTCMGESFASRVAASLLNAIELPELITTTQAQYEATAIELATNPTKLKAIKMKLERNRLTTPLFDTKRFTKHIEAAYTQMYERYRADLPPVHIYIED